MEDQDPTRCTGRRGRRALDPRVDEDGDPRHRPPRRHAVAPPHLWGGGGAAAGGAEVTEVKAELVGNVWKIKTQPGAQVAEEDELLILESMKMEIPVTAPRAGTGKEIRVKEGEVVKEGQVLVVLE